MLPVPSDKQLCALLFVFEKRYCPSGSPSNFSMRRSSRCSRPCDAGLLAFASRDLSWWRDCFSDYLYHWSRQSTWLELQGNCGVFRCKLWVSHSYVLLRGLISSFNSTHETNQRNTTHSTPNDIQTHWNCLGFKTPFALQSWWLIAKSIKAPHDKSMGKKPPNATSRFDPGNQRSTKSQARSQVRWFWSLPPPVWAASLLSWWPFP